MKKTKKITIEQLAKLTEMEFAYPYGDESQPSLDNPNLNTSWGIGCTKKQYQTVEKKIRNFKITRKEYSVYLWCDVSGYEYWVKNQEEPNYIQVTVTFKRKTFSGNIEQLKKDISNASCVAEGLAADNMDGSYWNRLK